MRRLLRAAAFGTALALLPAPVAAQVFVGQAKPRAGSAEIGGGGFWLAGQDLASSTATLTSNPSSGSSGFDLFDADPSVDPAFGANATLGVYLTPSLAIEGGFQYSRPKLTVRLSNDVEDAPGVTASETINSYLFTGSLVYHFAAHGQTVPFIAGGAGHIRDVHEGNELVETGVEYHGKAGIKSWFGRRRNVGFRAEGGVSIRDGGFSPDEDRRMAPFAGASLLYLF
jgi:hypothetical protein